MTLLGSDQLEPCLGTMLVAFVAAAAVVGLAVATAWAFINRKAKVFVLDFAVHKPDSRCARSIELAFEL